MEYWIGDNDHKRAVCSYPEMVSSNTTVDFIDYPYRHVAVSPHQQALKLAQNLAYGSAFDFYLIGRLDNHRDRSGFDGIKPNISLSHSTRRCVLRFGIQS
ncbi:MAG: hypothetical protein QGH37_23850 [Candidatus Poribacteria bacterium]|jgi:hypothetical protein|nr:hypothetical protein [Candidatus Poribacteria bacterium]MDP6961741.1 hypothetical protein [Dehalococcoidia bacterium]